MTTIRPSKATTLVEAAKASPPTGSNTIRAPLPPVMRITSAGTSVSWVAMTWRAPWAFRASALALVRVAAMVSAPAQLASWMAAIPTLEEAAGTITKSPGPALPTSITAMAVKYCIHTEAASSGPSQSGIGIRLLAGTIASSA